MVASVEGDTPLSVSLAERPIGTPQHAVILVPSTGEFDTRSHRIAAGLVARGHQVTLITRWAPGMSALELAPIGYQIIRVDADPLRGLPASRVVRAFLWRHGHPAGAIGHNIAAIGAIRANARRVMEVAPRSDLVHGMAFMGVPVALRLGRRDGIPVVYDALDLYVDAGRLATLPGPVRAGLAWVERRWARRATAVLSANGPYASVQARRFGRAPVVIYNGSLRFSPPTVPERRFHDRLGIPSERRIVLYHGGFSAGRGIEQLIEAIKLVPDATLVLMGYGALADMLVARAAEPELVDRLRVMPAVPPVELLDWIASADVAAMPIQPTTRNHRLSTPNKLFEAMSARVPILASDLPGMGPVVRATGSGLLVDPTDPVAIAAGLVEILDAPRETRERWRAAGLGAPSGPYGWDRQFARLLDVYASCTGRPW